MVRFFKNRAYTLAETLITVGIIGVVAAMSIPLLIVNYQKTVTVNKLKYVYSQINNAIKLSEVDSGDLSGWKFSSRTGASFFEEYLQPYMRGVTKVALKKTGMIYKESSGARETGLALLRDLNSANIYTTLNGVQLFFGSVTVSGSNASSVGFIIDTNGYDPPNQFGKDLFIFTISAQKGLYPMGFYNTSEFTFNVQPNRNRKILLGLQNPKTGSGYRYKCSKTGRGMWCGALIMADGWQIKRDYPW